MCDVLWPRRCGLFGSVGVVDGTVLERQRERKVGRGREENGERLGEQGEVEDGQRRKDIVDEAVELILSGNVDTHPRPLSRPLPISSPHPPARQLSA